MNFSFSNTEFEELFPEEEPTKIRPMSSSAVSASTKIAVTDSKKVTCPVINCSSLHENDGVHYIRGLTPREDSSRSCSISATPSDRTKTNIPTATSLKVGNFFFFLVAKYLSANLYFLYASLCIYVYFFLLLYVFRFLCCFCLCAFVLFFFGNVEEDLLTFISTCNES